MPENYGPEFIEGLRKRHVWQMRRTLDVLRFIVRHVTHEQATTFRDGPDGWTTLEVVCHLRDFDEVFFSRARMMIEQDNPQLPAYDHEAMARDGAYNQQSLPEALEALSASRAEFIAFFKSLTPEQWERGGIHPERGHFSMTDALMQVGLHDLDHIEQITRILAQAD